MNVLPTRLVGLLLLEARAFPDSRGWFFEAWKAENYREFGLGGPFVQDNVSWSHENVLRGLHVQNPRPQGKLIQVLEGAIWDVALDLRLDSPTFGQWEAHELSAENRRQFYIPVGFAHGFVVTKGPALVTYKCTEAYFQAGEFTVRFDDPSVGIAWPGSDWLVSDKDLAGLRLADVPRERLF